MTGAPQPRSTRAEVLGLRVVLAVLGALMRLASRRSARFRRQVTRDLVVEISSGDGAHRLFVFRAATRTMATTARRSLDPEVALRFATARDGLLTLLSPSAVGRIVEGMNYGGTRIEGNAVLVLWFYGLSRVVLPIGRSRVPRHRIPIPVREPETREPYASRIVREPAVDELDPAWTAAWRARALTLQLRGPDGARLPPG